MPLASFALRAMTSGDAPPDGDKAAADRPAAAARSPAIMAPATMIPTPPDDLAKKKKKKAAKVRSAWISFIGRILAQVIGAAASVVFGLFILQRYQSSSHESKNASAAPAAHPAAVRERRSPGETAVAVLPLANFSGDAKQEYFVDGLTEALTASLAQVKNMRVISRTSSMAYKSGQKPLPEIARELNVDMLVEGSVTRDGDRVRVTAQLIDGVTDEHLWARSFDRRMKDVLTLQDEIARAIAAEVGAVAQPTTQSLVDPAVSIRRRSAVSTRSAVRRAAPPRDSAARVQIMTHRPLAIASLVLALAGTAQPAFAQAAPASQPTFRWDDHPSIRFGGGTHIDLRARFSGDVRDSDVPLPEEEIGAFDIARRRIGVEGEIRNIFDFQVERELISGGDGWRDVFVNYKQFDYAQVIRSGSSSCPSASTRTPARPTSTSSIRSLAASFLAPGRDIGVQVHGRVAKRILRYELGVFEHDGRNARTNDTTRVTGGQTIAGRVRVEPFRHSKSPARELADRRGLHRQRRRGRHSRIARPTRCSTPRSSAPITWSAAGGSAAASKRNGGRVPPP